MDLLAQYQVLGIEYLRGTPWDIYPSVVIVLYNDSIDLRIAICIDIANNESSFYCFFYQYITILIWFILRGREAKLCVYMYR